LLVAIDRKAEALQLADELLTDFELIRLRPTHLVLKASRLARLLDDAEALDWLSIEISGYEPHTAKGGLPPKPWKAVVRSRRTYVDDEGTTRADTVSVSQLESMVDSARLRMGAAADAPVSISSANPQQFVTSGPGNALERRGLQDMIVKSQPLLDKILGAVHDYVAEKEVELRFGNAIETSFVRIRDRADNAIARLVPGVARQLAAAIELVGSDNPEHWSDAAAYCRKLIKAVADELQPIGSDIGGRANGPDNYINRLVFWIQEREPSETAREVMVSDLEYLGRRLDSFAGAGNKGAHATVDQHDADRFIVGTYVLLSDTLHLSSEASTAAEDDVRAGDAPSGQQTATAEARPSAARP
jgi:hypothetical protein